MQAPGILLASLALAFAFEFSLPAARLAALQAVAPQPPAQQIPSASGAPSQASDPIAYDQQSLPQDPQAALELADKANGLASDELKPWHLKARYQAYDAKGKPASQGTFEMFWGAKDSYRVSYTGEAFTQSLWVTPEGNFRTGSDASVPYAESMIRAELLEPLGRRKEGPLPTLRPRKSGAVALICFDSRRGDSPYFDEYCFDEGKPVLRTKGSDGYGMVYNRVALFQHRFVATKLNLRDGAEPVLDLDVDQLGGMTPADTQALAPPSDATRIVPGPPSPKTITVSPRVIAGHIVHKEAPTYPVAAKQRRSQGTVRIAATIGKNGVVHDLHIVHDPDSELSQAALDAVSKWRYQPYLLDGEPVEVHTMIQVTFRLGG